MDQASNPQPDPGSEVKQAAGHLWLWRSLDGWLAHRRHASRGSTLRMLSAGVCLILVATIFYLVDTHLLGAGDSTDGSAAESDVWEGAGAPAPVVKDLLLTLSLDEGWLVEHDLHFTNVSGEHLTEVEVSIQVTGEDAAPVVERYWSAWSLGQVQLVSVPIEHVTNIQRVTVSGSADQGRFDLEWRIGK